MLLNIADGILRIAKSEGYALTPMQLTKLAYIAHGWHLAFYDTPLFSERIEAWRYGPVMPDLYQATKRYGRAPIPLEQIGGVDDARLPAKTMEFLTSVYESYKGRTGIDLSRMTHMSGTPWVQT